MSNILKLVLAVLLSSIFFADTRAQEVISQPSGIYQGVMADTGNGTVSLTSLEERLDRFQSGTDRAYSLPGYTDVGNMIAAAIEDLATTNELGEIAIEPKFDAYTNQWHAAFTNHIGITNSNPHGITTAMIGAAGTGEVVSAIAAAIAPLATTAQLAQVQASIPSTNGLASTSYVAAVVAPLASTTQLADAVATLVRTSAYFNVTTGGSVRATDFKLVSGGVTTQVPVSVSANGETNYADAAGNIDLGTIGGTSSSIVTGSLTVEKPGDINFNSPSDGACEQLVKWTSQGGQYAGLGFPDNTLHVMSSAYGGSQYKVMVDTDADTNAFTLLRAIEVKQTSGGSSYFSVTATGLNFNGSAYYVDTNGVQRSKRSVKVSETGTNDFGTTIIVNGTTNTADTNGVWNLGTISGSTNGGGWTNLAFDGTGNAITGATADATTLTLQRGTINGGGITNGQTGVTLAGTFSGYGSGLTNVADSTARASITAMGDAIHSRILATVTNGTATLWASSSAWYRVNCDTNALTNWVIDTTGVSAGDTVAMAVEIYRPNANTWAWMPGVTNASPATNATTLNFFVLISGATNWLVNP